MVFSFVVSYAQTSEIDSLKKYISTRGDDSLKVNALIALSGKYLGSDLQESIRCGYKALDLADEIEFQKGRGYAYKAIGLGNYYQANYPEAVIQFQNSLAVFDSLSFQVGIANILSNLGATYFNAGDDTKAIDFYLRSLRISEQINDRLRIGTALNNIGGVYNNKAATENKSLEYFLRALPIFRKIDYQDGVATVSMNVGELYKKKKLYDSAIYYFETSLAIFDESVESTFPLTFLGEIYAQRNDYDRAYAYHNKAIKIAESVDAKLELIQSIIGIAKTQKKHGQLKQSIASFQRAQKLAEEAIARKELKDIYEGLADLYSENKDFRKAHQYDTLLSSVKDSLYNNDNFTKIQQLQFNFDIEKKEDEIDLLTKDQALKSATIQRQRVVNYAAGITGFFLIMVLIGFYSRHRYTQKTNKIIKDERDRSKELLLNILPAETAHELETNGHAQTRFYESVTVLFADFRGFSSISRTLPPQELVAELNEYFIAFDEIVEKYNLEKIKTIGDAYMCAGGIPTANDTHPFNAVEAGLAMQDYMTKRNAARTANGLEPWGLRIGAHIGPIVAGVVGKKKYAYDIWGDTVNIASRMESSSEGGRVNISSSLYDIVKDRYRCHYRGKIFAKNIGEIDMYFVESGNSNS
ncbi:MAG TPA: adenylate/guanylate cyclase domain-containing protein [Chryseolinea sp.]